MTDETRGPLLIPDAARKHLSRSAPVMRTLIEQRPPPESPADRDRWRALVGSIVGQQLSVAAARTIRSRIAALGNDGFPDPPTILGTPDEALRACGLSRAKLTYLRDLAGG